MVRKYYKFAQWHWHWYISAWHVRINCPQPAASVGGTQKSSRLLGNDRILGNARRRGSWKWSLYVFILCSMLKKMLDDVAKRQQRKRCTAELQWVSPMPSDNSWKYINKKILLNIGRTSKKQPWHLCHIALNALFIFNLFKRMGFHVLGLIWSKIQFNQQWAAQQWTQKEN